MERPCVGIVPKIHKVEGELVVGDGVKLSLREVTARMQGGGQDRLLLGQERLHMGQDRLHGFSHHQPYNQQVRDEATKLSR